MRKIMLKIKKVPGMLEGLEIMTNSGARVKVSKTHPTFLPVLEDCRMSDQELLNWYLSRYGKFGLLCNVISDSKEIPKELNRSENLSASEKENLCNSEKSECEECSIVEKKENADCQSENSECGESSISDNKNEDKGDPAMWNYFDLVRFAKSHGIDPGGREKALYVEAVRGYLVSL